MQSISKHRVQNDETYLNSINPKLNDHEQALLKDNDQRILKQ